jgi:hypothetical protein
LYNNLIKIKLTRNCMSNQLLVHLTAPVGYGSINHAASYVSLENAERNIARLERNARCRMCFSKAINCFFLPINIACRICPGTIIWCCDNKTGHDMDSSGKPYSDCTSCQAPCWNPKTDHPGYSLPETCCDIVGKDICDPYAICLCCNQESLAEHYMTTADRNVYAQAKKSQTAYSMLNAGPQPQVMDMQQMAQSKLNEKQVKFLADERVSILSKAIYKQTGQKIAKWGGPIKEILELIGPVVSAPKKPVIHCAPPPRLKRSSSSGLAPGRW